MVRHRMADGPWAWARVRRGANTVRLQISAVFFSPPPPHRHPTPTPLVCPFQFLSQLKQKRLTLTVFVLALYTSAGMTLSPFKRVQYFSL